MLEGMGAKRVFLSNPLSIDNEPIDFVAAPMNQSLSVKVFCVPIPQLDSFIFCFLEPQHFLLLKDSVEESKELLFQITKNG